ncbi:MAG: hypothetical protein RL710_2967 [Pseudomonadota bacterium]
MQTQKSKGCRAGWRWQGRWRIFYEPDFTWRATCRGFLGLLPGLVGLGLFFSGVLCLYRTSIVRKQLLFL